MYKMCDMEIQTCDPCNFRSKDSFSVKYCKTCQENLCKECAEVHRSSKATRSHFLVNFNDISVNSIAWNAVERLEKCINHPGKVLEFFCVDHTDLMCSLCILHDKSRNCKNVIEVSSAGETLSKSAFTEKLRSDLQAVKQKLEHDVQSVSHQQTATKTANANIKQKLTDTRHKFFSLFNKFENEILSNMNLHEINERRQLEILEERIHQELKCLCDASLVFESIVENGSASDIFRCILSIGQFFEQSAANLDTENLAIWICQPSVKLSKAMDVLVSGTVAMIERAERYYKFRISDFPVLQTSVSEFLEIVGRKGFSTNSYNGIRSPIEETDHDLCFKEHVSNAGTRFDPFFERLGNEEKGNMDSNMILEQRTKDYLLSGQMTVGSGHKMMDILPLRPSMPRIPPLLFYPPPVQGMRPFIVPSVTCSYSPITKSFSVQHPPSFVNIHSENCKKEQFNIESSPLNVSHVNSQTEIRQPPDTQLGIPEKDEDITEEVTEQTAFQHMIKTVKKPQLSDLTTLSNDADVEEQQLSMQHQKMNLQKTDKFMLDLPKPKRRRNKRNNKKDEQLPIQTPAKSNDENSQSSELEEIEFLNADVEYFDETENDATKVRDPESKFELGMDLYICRIHSGERKNINDTGILNKKESDDKALSNTDTSGVSKYHKNEKPLHRLYKTQVRNNSKSISDMLKTQGTVKDSSLPVIAKERFMSANPTINDEIQLPRKDLTESCTGEELCLEVNGINLLDNNECDKTDSVCNENPECKQNEIDEKCLRDNASLTFQPEDCQNDSVREHENKSLDKESIFVSKPFTQIEGEKDLYIDSIESTSQTVENDDRRINTKRRDMERETEPINLVNETDLAIETECENMATDIKEDEIHHVAESKTDVNHTVEMKVKCNKKSESVVKDDIAECEKQETRNKTAVVEKVRDDIESSENDSLPKNKEVGASDGATYVTEYTNIIYHEEKDNMSLHAASRECKEEHNIINSQPGATDAEIIYDSVLEIPLQGKKHFDLFSVLAPSDKNIIVIDLYNCQAVMLESLNVVDAIQLSAKMVSADLLNGNLIATCHKNRCRISLLEYSPKFKIIRVINTLCLAMCVKSVTDDAVLVSMCDANGRWHLHLMSINGQLIMKLKLKRTIMDGFSIGIICSDSYRFGYRILQCCEESNALYCFERDGKDIFRFNVRSPNCIAVHESGYIFLIDNYDNIHVLSSSGKQIYKTKCCADVTSIAVTPSMDKLLLTRFKTCKITVLSIVLAVNEVS